MTRDRLSYDTSRVPRFGRWSEADYFALDETNFRIELIDGQILPSPAPTVPRQGVAHQLLSRLWHDARANGLGAYPAVALRLGAGRIIVPDLLVAHVDRLAGYADPAAKLGLAPVTLGAQQFEAVLHRIAHVIIT